LRHIAGVIGGEMGSVRQHGVAYPLAGDTGMERGGAAIEIVDVVARLVVVWYVVHAYSFRHSRNFVRA
jgi:hypothetical protein